MILLELVLHCFLQGVPKVFGVSTGLKIDHYFHFNRFAFNFYQSNQSCAMFLNSFRCFYHSLGVYLSKM